MQLFYTTNIEGEFAKFGQEETRHLIQVLRKRMGDTIDFVDGKGTFYRGEIVEASKRECLVKILEQRQEESVKPNLYIGIAPTKNIDRLEWFLEKATEIGIHSISPLLCQRSERKRIRNDRLEKVLLAAMKQSLKAKLPELAELSALNDFIQQDVEVKQKYIAYCNDDQLPHLKSLCEKGKSTMILIGPEGDFSSEEIEQAKAMGFQGVSLGNSRLRTETAGVVACTIFNILNE